MSYLEHQKDATYITVSSRPTPESEPGARIVKSMSLRAAVAKGKVVRLGESNKPGEPLKPGAFEVNKFFRRLSFKHQVRRGQSYVSRLEFSDVFNWVMVTDCCFALFSDERPLLQRSESKETVHLKGLTEG